MGLHIEFAAIFADGDGLAVGTGCSWIVERDTGTGRRFFENDGHLHIIVKKSWSAVRVLGARILLISALPMLT